LTRSYAPKSPLEYAEVHEIFHRAAAKALRHDTRREQSLGHGQPDTAETQNADGCGHRVGPSDLHRTTACTAQADVQITLHQNPGLHLVGHRAAFDQRVGVCN
jgi:hypothetical protein